MTESIRIEAAGCKPALLNDSALVDWADVQTGNPAGKIREDRPLSGAVDPALLAGVAQRSCSVDRAGQGQIALKDPQQGKPGEMQVAGDLRRLREALTNDIEAAFSEAGEEVGVTAKGVGPFFGGESGQRINVILLLAEIVKHSREADVELLRSNLQVQMQANLSQAQSYLDQGRNALASAIAGAMTQLVFDVGGAAAKFKALSLQSKSLKTELASGRQALGAQASAPSRGQAGAIEGADGAAAPDVAKSNNPRARADASTTPARPQRADLPAESAPSPEVARPDDTAPVAGRERRASGAVEESHSDIGSADPERLKRKAGKLDPIGTVLLNTGPIGAKIVDSAFGVPLSYAQYGRKLSENTEETMRSAAGQNLDSLQRLAQQLEAIMNGVAEAGNAHNAAIASIIDKI